MVWPWLATKEHAVTLLPLPLAGWERESKEKGKTRGSGQGLFNRMTKEANSNNNNTDKKNIRKPQ